ncbi:ATP-binding cassette domain-containing protein [Muricoccus vinaceus]|uniref:ATP-binding cassette domain-containing protein n=1 Tax=Muricoccus vinaceus TaxID=424704 RepID=A0ABV6IZY2_9PROT
MSDILAYPRPVRAPRQITLQGLWIAVLGLLLSIGALGAMLAAPLLTMHVFDGVLQSRNGDTLVALAVAYALIVLLGGALRYLRAALVAAATDAAGRQLQFQALGASVRGALAGDRTRGLAALRDAGEVRRLLGGAVASDLMDLLMVPAAVGLLFVLHPYYGSLALLGCAILTLLGALADLTTRKLVRAASNEQARVTAALTGRLRSRDMIDGLGMLPAILRRWRPDAERSIEIADAAQRRARAIQELATFVGLVLQMATICVGIWLVTYHHATPGSILAATMLAGMASSPVSRVVATWRDWAFGVVAWQRLSRFIADTATPAPPPANPSAPAGLSVEHLTLRTPDGLRSLVRDLDLSICAGQIIGIRGPNGVGKSTLLRAILGLSLPEAGVVRLAGEATYALPGRDGLAVVASRVGYLPQGAQLLEGSVLDNIRRFTDAPAEQAVAAARLVGAHAMIGRLSDGYGTPAGLTSGLSGGQKQMVALARAFFGTPSLLVLDEPEAGLDANLIRDLRAAVAQAQHQGTITLLVTHDPAGWEGIVSGWLDLAADGGWHFEAVARGTNA